MKWKTVGICVQEGARVWITGGSLKFPGLKFQLCWGFLTTNQARRKGEGWGLALANQCASASAVVKQGAQYGVPLY